MLLNYSFFLSMKALKKLKFLDINYTLLKKLNNGLPLNLEKNLGIHVKLQRNALSVLEPLMGQEEDGEINHDHSSCGSNVGEKENFLVSFFTICSNQHIWRH